MTIELLDTEEAQTEDPLEVQVRTAALCSVPCTHHGGQGQPQAASWGSHHGSPCTCWPSTGHKTSTREASVQVERSPWKRIRRWELRKPWLLPPAADTVPSAHSQPSHSDPAACGRRAPCAWSSELWVPPDHQEKTHLAHTLRRTFRLVPARQGAGPRSPSCLHRAGGATHHSLGGSLHSALRWKHSKTREGRGLHTRSLPEVSSKCAFVKLESGGASCFNRVVSS